MCNFISILRQVLRGQQGAATLEYGLVVLAVVVGASAAVLLLTQGYGSVASGAATAVLAATAAIIGND